MAKGVRTFVGIFPPAESLARVLEIQSVLKSADPSVRWETLRKLHITLRFLGDIDANQTQQILSGLAAVGNSLPPISIGLSRLGCFPRIDSPRIIWLGTGRIPEPELGRCALEVERVCVAAGIKEEERPFSPHITLGRAKGKISPSLIKTIESTTFEPVQFLCAELLVMKSDLSPSGSAYSLLSTIPLKH